MPANSVLKLRSHSGTLHKGLDFQKRKRLRKMTNSQDTNNEAQRALDELTSIEELREEISRLRRLNNLQNVQLVQMQQRIADNTGDAGNQLVRTLVDGLRGLNIDAKIPKFCEPDNPNHFIEKLEKYFTLKNLQGNRLNVLDGCFEGRARAWFESQRNSLCNYNDFKTKFLGEFFSIPIRVKLKSNWLAKRFDNTTDSLQTYFLNQIKEAQYIIPQCEPYELYFTIIQQMPMRVREILSTVDFNDYNKISQALSQLDSTFREKVNIQNLKPRNQMGNMNREMPSNHNNNARGQQYPQNSRRENSDYNQRNGNKISNVVNARIQADSARIDTQIYNGQSRNSSLSLPDVRRPPPPMSLSMNHMAYSSIPNHLNW